MRSYSTFNSLMHKNTLTHWGRMSHICVSKLTITGPDNGLAPTIIWTNAGILLIRTLGTNFSEILIKIDTFSLKKMHLKMSSGKRQPSCLGLNVLSGRYCCWICTQYLQPSPKNFFVVAHQIDRLCDRNVGHQMASQPLQKQLRWIYLM